MLDLDCPQLVQQPVKLAVGDRGLGLHVVEVVVVVDESAEFGGTSGRHSAKC
jgi:hypothetical protein